MTLIGGVRAALAAVPNAALVPAAVVSKPGKGIALFPAVSCGGVPGKLARCTPVVMESDGFAAAVVGKEKAVGSVQRKEESSPNPEPRVWADCETKAGDSVHAPARALATFPPKEEDATPLGARPALPPLTRGFRPEGDTAAVTEPNGDGGATDAGR